MSTPTRVHAGVPAGGQFAVDTRAEPDVTLASAPERVSWKDEVRWGQLRHDDGTDESRREEARTATGSSAFDDRVRMLLGAPADSPVSVDQVTTGVNHWGWETWESDEQVTVRAGSLERTFERLPDLWTALDYADQPTPTDESLLADLGRRVRVTHIGYDGKAIMFDARVGNVRGQSLLLVVPAEDDSWRRSRDVDGAHCPAGSGERWLYTRPDAVLAYCPLEPATCAGCKCEVPEDTPRVGSFRRCPSCLSALTCSTCGTARLDVSARDELDGALLCADCLAAAVCTLCDAVLARGQGHQDWCS